MQSQQEHGQRLECVPNRLTKASITLNPEKCVFCKRSVKFLGHVIEEAGIHPDPGKIQEIQKLQLPTNVTKSHRFYGNVDILQQVFSQPIT